MSVPVLPIKEQPSCTCEPGEPSWITCAFHGALEVCTESFLEDVGAEIERARTKFPGSRLMLAALTEEVGELAQAMLKVAAGKWKPERIWEEAIQVAAMAARCATEGDSSFEAFEEPD